MVWLLSADRLLQLNHIPHKKLAIILAEDLSLNLCGIASAHGPFMAKHLNCSSPQPCNSNILMLELVFLALSMAMINRRGLRFQTRGFAERQIAKTTPQTPHPRRTVGSIFCVAVLAICTRDVPRTFHCACMPNDLPFDGAVHQPPCDLPMLYVPTPKTGPLFFF
ncbi:hypothetical protein BS50DRAFT_254631 [Corynespora cassiicola Philippines]|uniref:Uncharacterized protein n=1 Tax=Corynespora cassiicola Philippines TaxID=1448308 RepID=A0A2T2P4E4_CORCC|nr:hypothetical protein BS50DRAFT_254631 [Corynespora cassiicola Philippines]